MDRCEDMADTAAGVVGRSPSYQESHEARLQHCFLPRGRSERRRPLRKCSVEGSPAPPVGCRVISLYGRHCHENR